MLFSVDSLFVYISHVNTENKDQCLPNDLFHHVICLQNYLFMLHDVFSYHFSAIDCYNDVFLFNVNLSWFPGNSGI